MNVRRFNRNVWLIGTLALASIVVVVGLYFWNFPNGFSKDPQDWADFGAYAGGVLGPLFAFLAFIAGLENLRVMRRQHSQDELIEAIRNLARDYERVSSMLVTCEEPWVWGNDLDAAKDIKELPLRTLLESDSIDWETHLGLLREGLNFRLQPNGELFQDRDI